MRLLRIPLLLILVITSVSIVPLVAQAAPPAEITCEGDLILTVSFTPVGDVSYRVNGVGPGLPTSGIPVSIGVPVTLTWTVAGPDTWTGLVLEADGGIGSWGESGFNRYLEASCEAAPVAGCDVLVNIPSQAVSGQFTSNSEIYGSPGIMSNAPYIPAGSTYLVAGQDASETYYKVLISCEWVWVRKDTVGPNYDDVWNGQPLPGTIVD